MDNCRPDDTKQYLKIIMRERERGGREKERERERERERGRERESVCVGN